ncbi:MAG: hypothetical protein WC657_06165 [Candidatus Paceibacterota bacterium]|jgi:hypothetical protein
MEPFELTEMEMVEALGHGKRGENRYAVVAQAAQRKVVKWLGAPCDDSSHRCEIGTSRFDCAECDRRLEAALGEK